MHRIKAFVDRISTRLIGLLLLPVLIASVLTGMFALERHNAAENLSQVRSDAELVAQLSQLRAQVTLERTLVSGFSAIDALGLVPANDGSAVELRPDSIETNGFNMLEQLDEGQMVVDELIAMLPTNPNGSAAAESALTRVGQIDDVRAMSSGPDPQYDAAVIAYDLTVADLDRWNSEVSRRLLRGTNDHPETRALHAVLTDLEVLTEAHDSDLRLFVPLLANFGRDSEPIIDQLIGNAAIADRTATLIGEDLPPGLEDLWRDYLLDAKAGNAATNKIIRNIRATDGQPLALDQLLQAGRDVEAVSTRLKTAALFQTAVGEALVDQAAADEAAAREALNKVAILSLMALLAIVLIATIVARHLATSMRQLGNAAESLQTGNFDAEELPTSGPREIVDTARAFSTLTDTLRAVDAHATAIATGESVSADLLLPVPGHIGESLRNSLQRVESMADRLRHEANHDELTGLFNRAGVWEEVETLLAEPDTLITTMFIDLDRFKRVNDTYGHKAGDLLLTAAGYRLQNVAGEHRMVARLGGDEFLVVASDIKDEDQAIRLAGRIADELDEPFTIEGRVLRVSASVGVAQEYADDQTVADILQVADLAAYEAKRHRSKSVVFSDDVLLHQAVESLKLEDALRGSWDRGELSLHLQPLVRPENNETASAEALMRWTRPDGTSVSPAQFIPIAEESGMIVTIDEWMIDETCRQLAEWRTIGHPAGDLRIAVNISGQHFTDGDLVATIQQACTLHDIEPSQLVIEVTESCAIEDISQTVAVLDELHALGIRISLDDFGTGYSSLSYLQQLPIDTVKIDKSFIDDLPTGGANAKIVELVATLSTVLELAVVAEGVETLDQADCLQALGIHYLQGYYFARPMPAALFGKWIEESVPAFSTELTATK